MLSCKYKQTPVFRIICMVMLMLIQFDAYGYEITNAFREKETVQTVFTEDAVLLEESYEADGEWSDLVYRGMNQQLRIFVRAVMILFVSFLFIPVLLNRQRVCRRNPGLFGKAASHAHLLYCTFLI